MKKKLFSEIFLLTLLVFLLLGCTTGTKILSNSGIANLPESKYKILPEDKIVVSTSRVWILFIPIGGKSEERREAECLNRMMKKDNADGVLSGVYIHKKVTIPLILFGYSYKTTTLTGHPYKLQTDTTGVK
jgi:hypothetical protein